jgi:hypothetical protein
MPREEKRAEIQAINRRFLRACSNPPSRCEGLLLDNVESRQVILFKVSRTEILTHAEMSKSFAPLTYQKNNRKAPGTDKGKPTKGKGAPQEVDFICLSIPMFDTGQSGHEQLRLRLGERSARPRSGGADAGPKGAQSVD